MGGNVIFIFIAIIGLILAMIPASLARSKGRDYWTWYVFGFLLFPVALVVALIMKKEAINNNADTKKNIETNSTTKDNNNVSVVIAVVLVLMVLAFSWKSWSKYLFGAFAHTNVNRNAQVQEAKTAKANNTSQHIDNTKQQVKKTTSSIKDTPLKTTVIFNADFTKDPVITNGLSIKAGNAVYRKDFSVWALSKNGYFQAEFSLNGTPRSGLLRLTHLSSKLDQKQGYSPISISVNGKYLFTHRQPGGGGDFITETYNLDSYLGKGMNTLRIETGNDSKSQYWLRALIVDVIV